MSLTNKQSLNSSNLENNKDAVFLLDSDGFFLNANANTEKVIGYVPFELVGTSLAQITPTQEIPRIKSLFQDVISGNIVQFDAVLTHKNGREVYVNLEFNLKILNGQVTGVFTTVREVIKVKSIFDVYSKILFK